MKANEVKLLGLLQGPRQFTIPIYQRPYSWSYWDCRKLFEDVLLAGNDESRISYFIGSVVYYQGAAHAIGTVPESLVIDGQQRLTTMVLMLTALARFLVENNEPLSPDTSSEEIRTYFLTNALKQGELYQRLLLTRRDKETLISVVSGNPLPTSPSQRVVDNFDYFMKSVNAENMNALWAGINKLMVVGVVLEPGVDNPQLIFESLNSTGKPLDQADLIRNYVLMGQTPALQNELYERYWFPMESAFGDNYTAMFNEFMRDFLTMKKGQLVNIDTVYKTFKEDYARGRVGSSQVEELARELYNHATYYVRLRRPEREEHVPLRAALERLKSFGVLVAYPYLLDAYAACVSGNLTKDELTEVVRTIEVYALRRAVCDLRTNTMNSTFASFGRQIDRQNYLASVGVQFRRLTYHRRFPGDQEFRQCFIERNAYNATRTLRYLLEHLENYKRKEIVGIGNYTIEHILPQNKNVSAEWQQELGENWADVYVKYLHTIGNLTLTAYNPEMSDKAFSIKKTMPNGFADSPIQLNKSVVAETQWNEEAILRRAGMLADRALKIWPEPRIIAAVAEEEALAEDDEDDEVESSEVDLFGVEAEDSQP